MRYKHIVYLGCIVSRFPLTKYWPKKQSHCQFVVKSIWKSPLNSHWQAAEQVKISFTNDSFNKFAHRYTLVWTSATGYEVSHLIIAPIKRLNSTLHVNRVIVNGTVRR